MDTVGTPFRKDIEGLRGVAVQLVIFFHVGWHRFAGGFVGVDVFFVLSGFLIAQQLFRESERNGHVDPRAFREVAPIATMSPVPLICGTERCVGEQGGIIVYADATHLSAEFTVSKVDAVQAMLSDAVR